MEIHMEPILFYGVPEGCSFSSIVPLEWSGLRYRLCRIEMPGVVTSEAYARVNPVRETPALMNEDGAILRESTAILGKIARAAPARLGGGDPDRLTEALAFLNTTFFSAFNPLWHAVEHALPPSEAAALRAYGTAAVARAHGALERLMTGRDWLLGDRPSAADAYFAGIARWADFHGVIARRDYPGVDRLYGRLRRDPAGRFAVAIEHERPAESAGGFAGHVTLDEALGLFRAAA
jgi:glutathione S-transferase